MNPTLKKIIDSQRLESEHIRPEFEAEVEHKTLQNEVAEDAEQSWKNIRDAVSESAVSILGYR